MNLSLLEELKAHHSRVADGIDEVARLTSIAVPESHALALARVRLSKASKERAKFIAANVYPVLTASADGALLDQLVELSHEFLKKREASSEHVVRWDAKSIEGDWAGYCASSLRIRNMMRERIKREATVLYGPLASLRGQ